MRKISLYLICVVMLAFAQGCSLKHSLGYVNNELAWRQSFGDMKTEVSLGGNVFNQFGDSVTDMPGYQYHSEETGYINTGFSLGLACYYRVFQNDIFDLSAGLKFTNYFNVSYNYTYYFNFQGDQRKYHYEESMQLDFFNSNKASILFPDLEIKCPFLDNLKFVLNVELVYIAWHYNGGYYKYEFWQDVASNEDYSEGSSDKINGPGAINGIRTGSGIFSIGGINAGILYYF